MRKRLGQFSLALIGILFAVTNGSAEDAPIHEAINVYTEALQTTNPEHRRRGFLRAEQLFRQTAEGIENQPAVRSSELYLNIGNAALQNERIGPAIAAYRSSLMVNPSNLTAKQNLGFARTLLPDWIRNEDDLDFVDSLFFWAATASPLFLAITAAVCFAVGVMFFCVGVSRANVMLRNASVFPFLFWLVVLASVYGKYWNGADSELVVIQEATLYSADTENSSARIFKPLPDGAEVQLLQDRGRWLEVQVPGNISGWVLRSNVTRLDE